MAGILARVTREPRNPRQYRVPRTTQTLAGVSITEDNCIQIPAVRACIRYISEMVAVLPWRVKRDGADGPAIQPKHYVDYLLRDRPSPEYSSFQFRETLTHWALRWGNGYAEIERDQLGRPYALHPVQPWRCYPWRATQDIVAANGRLIRDGELYYKVANTNTADGASAGAVDIAAADMFHVRGFGDGPYGLGIAEYGSQSLGWARAAQLFCAAFFGNGMNVAGVVINKKGISDVGMRRQRAEFEALYKGPRNANRTAILDNDSEWKPIGTDPQKSQLVEVQKFLIEETCRLFGVPPHKVMHLERSTNNNIEHQALEVVGDCLRPWIERFEDEADYKLFGANRSGLYTDIDMRSLLRGDVTARIAYYKGMREMGAFNANRILEEEGENTIGPQGNVYTMNGTYKTVEQIIEGEQPKVAAGPENTSVDDNSGDGETDDIDREDESAAALLEPHRARIAAIAAACRAPETVT